MSSSCIKVFMDTFGLGLPHPLKCLVVITNGLTGIKDAFVKCLFILS